MTGSLPIGRAVLRTPIMCWSHLQVATVFKIALCAIFRPTLTELTAYPSGSDGAQGFLPGRIGVHGGFRKSGLGLLKGERGIGVEVSAPDQCCGYGDHA